MNFCGHRLNGCHQLWQLRRRWRVARRKRNQKPEALTAIAEMPRAATASSDFVGSRCRPFETPLCRASRARVRSPRRTTQSSSFLLSFAQRILVRIRLLLTAAHALEMKARSSRWVGHPASFSHFGIARSASQLHGVIRFCLGQNRFQGLLAIANRRTADQPPVATLFAAAAAPNAGPNGRPP